MRRVASLMLAVAALLVLPAIAVALSRELHGPAGSGSGSVDVQFTFKKVHAQKITRFEFNNIAATCKGNPPTAVSITFPKRIMVSRHGRFSATAKANGGRVVYTVSGRFVSLHKAAGKLRVTGTVPGCLSADTGKVHWSATG